MAMKLRTMLTLAVALAVLAATAFVFASERNSKRSVCHHENGRSGYTISVAGSSIPFHLGHGDDMGSCKGSPDR